MSLITEQIKRLRELADDVADGLNSYVNSYDLREAAETIEQLAAKVRKENGFIFPENPTNGDMLQAIFPNCVIDTDSCGNIATSIDGKIYWSKKWWNAPYKDGETE